MKHSDNFKELCAIGVTYDKVLTDNDLDVIRKHFYGIVGFRNAYMEKHGATYVTFLLSPGFLHTIKYYLKNEPTPSQLKGNEEAEELRKHIICVDDLQIILQDKT